MKKFILILSTLMISGLFAEESNTNIALLKLDAKGIDPNLADLISDALVSEINQTSGYTAMERSKMNEILLEQGFQGSGACNSECQVQMGQLLGIDQMVVGSIGKFEGTYIVNLRRLDLATAEIIQSSTVSIEGKVQDVMTQGVPQIVKEVCPPNSLQQSPPSSSSIEKPPIETSTAANLTPKNSEDIETSASKENKNPQPESSEQKTPKQAFRDGFFSSLNLGMGQYTAAYDPNFDINPVSKYGFSFGVDWGYAFTPNLPIFYTFRNRSSKFNGSEVTASYKENYQGIGFKYNIENIGVHLGAGIGISQIEVKIEALENAINSLKNTNDTAAVINNFIQGIPENQTAASAQQMLTLLEYLDQGSIKSSVVTFTLTLGKDWKVNQWMQLGINSFLSIHKSEEEMISPHALDNFLTTEGSTKFLFLNNQLFDERNQLRTSTLSYASVGLELSLTWD